MSTPAITDQRPRRTSSWPDIVFAGEAKRSTLSQAVARGRLVRIATGIYTGKVNEDPAAVVRREWWKILVHALPGAVISDRSARSMSPTGGVLTVVHDRRNALELPGLSIIPRKGPGALQWDTTLPDGIVLASGARGLLDNVAGSGDRYLSAGEVENWIADIVQREGETWLNVLRDRAKVLAAETRRPKAFARLNSVIAAALTTGPADGLVTPALRARSDGAPYDRRRVDLFSSLTEMLLGVAPDPLPALPAYAERRRLLPFYEAYFSNYIEGTEFTLDEAAAIVFEGALPAERPEDAHDVAGTYRIVSDEKEMRRVPRDAEEFIGLLKSRHGIMLGGRPDALPGQLKQRSNRAGSTVFVEPDLVAGTLRAGFAAARPLLDPFARALFTMFLVAEVHPFADGNGRIARVAMNAELANASETRILIPTVYRNNYLAALKSATNNASFAPLLATLRFAQRYTAQIDFSSRASAEADLERTNALLEPDEAEDNGLRLLLPTAFFVPAV
jgi:hypothetical protein